MATIVFTKPKLYPKQHAAIYAPQRYAICEASTKAGKTFGCLVWLTEQAIKCRRGQNVWWVAPIYPQAKMAYRRLKRMIPREFYESNETELTITLVNGAVIWFKGADKPDSLFGEDVYAAVIDEATRCKEDAWYAVRTTLTHTEGPIRIIGNVKGRKNWAWNLARRAEGGAPDMAYSKLTAHDAVEAGVLTAEEVADAQTMLPEQVFRELYLGEASDDAGNPFGLSHIEACTKDPMSNGKPVVWGWDLAKSVDWTVGIALDDKGAVCRLERWQTSWEDTIRRIFAFIGTTPAWIDSTGVGDPVTEPFLRQLPDTAHGFKFTSQTKQQLMEGLAVAIQHHQVTFPSGVLTNELKSFEFEVTRTGVRYNAPEGLHDDCVVALALAVHGRQRAVPMIEPISITRESIWRR